MSESSIKHDLENHPELSPILESDKDGNIICLGWISPICDLEEVQEFVKP